MIATALITIVKVRWVLSSSVIKYCGSQINLHVVHIHSLTNIVHTIGLAVFTALTCLRSCSRLKVTFTGKSIRSW